MKRILTLCAQPLFEARGSPIRVRAFLRTLGKAGIGVDVMTLPVGPNVGMPDSVKLFRVPNFLRAKSVAIGPSFPKFAFGLLIAIYAVFRVSTGRYGIVHGIEEMGLAALIAARLSGAKFVFEKHSDPSSHRSRSRIRNLVMSVYARIESFVCRKADQIVVTGPGLAEQTRGYRPKGVVRIIDDVPTSEMEANPASLPAWRKRFGCRGEETVFAYIGSFAEYQGVSVFIEATRMVLSTSCAARVVLVGGSEEDRSAVERIAVDGGFEDRVCLLSGVDPDEVPDFLAACDVLVSPRFKGNNTPLKVLDYLQSGRCVLATDTEANRLVLDSSTAWMVPPDALGLAGGMRYLVDRPDIREKLGNAGRELFVKRFGFDRFGRDLLEVFDPSGFDRGK